MATRSTKQNASPQQAPEVRRADDYQTIYTNSASIQISAYDVRILFGESSTSIGSNSPPAIDLKLGVVMSLHHAKALARLLQQNVDQYESTVGELHLPEHGTQVRPTSSKPS